MLVCQLIQRADCEQTANKTSTQHHSSFELRLKIQDGIVDLVILDLLLFSTFCKASIIGPNKSADGHYDVFKDSIIRYLGYANEVGEAFRALVNVRWVWLSYGVASTYVLADAVHKGWEASQTTEEGGSNNRASSVALAFTDTLIWQGLASVLLPGFTINRICFLTGHALRYTTRLPSPVRRWSTTAVGLGCIPFIVSPIDRSVHFAMDRSVRLWYGYHPKVTDMKEEWSQDKER